MVRRVLAVVAAMALFSAVPAAAQDSLCKRLGGGDAISTVVKSFLTKMRKDDPDKLGRFWLFRGSGGVAREEQLIVDFVQSATGCDRLYDGRDMRSTHKGMGLSSADWDRTVEPAARYARRIQGSCRAPDRGHRSGGHNAQCDR